MPASKSAPTEPSITARVLEMLQKYDDFLNAAELAILLDLPAKKLNSALWWLQKVQAIDAVEAGNTPYWFAKPGYDTRRRTIDERKVEDEPRKAKRRVVRDTNKNPTTKSTTTNEVTS